VDIGPLDKCFFYFFGIHIFITNIGTLDRGFILFSNAYIHS